MNLLIWLMNCYLPVEMFGVFIDIDAFFSMMPGSPFLGSKELNRQFEQKIQQFMKVFTDRGFDTSIWNGK